MKKPKLKLELNKIVVVRLTEQQQNIILGGDLIIEKDNSESKNGCGTAKCAQIVNMLHVKY